MGASQSKVVHTTTPAASGVGTAAVSGGAATTATATKRIWEPDTQLHPIVLGGQRGVAGQNDTNTDSPPAPPGGAPANGKEPRSFLDRFGLTAAAAPSSASAGDASFSGPSGIAIDPSKGGLKISGAFPVMHAPVLIIADSMSGRVRKLERSGLVSTLTASASKEGEKEDSSAAHAHSAAGMNRPVSVAVDSRSNVYVCDTASHCIRKRNAVTGEWSVVVGTPTAATAGAADSKSESAPAAAALPSVESAPPLKDGPAAAAALWYPTAIAIDTRDDQLYIADSGHFVVRKVNLRETITRGRTASSASSASGSSIVGIESVPNLTIRTLCGRARQGYRDGAPEEALFGRISGICVDSKQNVYVSDYQHHTIRRITPEGMVSTYAGRRNVSGSTDGIGAGASTDGSGGEATFCHPIGLCVDNNDNVYVCDSGNGWIRKITSDGCEVHTIQTSPRFVEPAGIASYAGQLYVSEPTTHLLYKIDLESMDSQVEGSNGGGGDRSCTRRMCT